MSESRWKRVTLANCIASVNGGVSVNSEDRPRGPGEIGVLKTSAISGGSFVASENKVVTARDRGRVAEPLQAGSVLFSRMNTPALVGDSCYVECGDPSLFLPDRLWQLQVIPGQVDARWLSYMFQSPQTREAIRALATGTSGSMKNIARKGLLSLEIAVPPFAQQKQIAKILATLDDQIGNSRRIIAKLRRTRESLGRDLLRVGDDGGWKSSDWEMTSLGAVVVAIESGKSPDCPNTPAVTGGRGVLKVSAVGADGFIEQENKEVPSCILVSDRDRVQRGDVLMTRANTPDLVGMACIVRGDPYTSLFLCDKTWRLRPAASITREFLLELLCSLPARRFVQAEATGTSGSMKNISKASVRRMPIPVPPLPDQGRIVEALSAARKREDSERRTLAGLRALKSGLMFDLLTGRVRASTGTVS